MTMIDRVFLIFLLQTAVCFADYCLFTPPEGWEIVKPKESSEYVQVGFLGKKSGGFRPCMNVAFEEDVDVSLKEYTRLVKELQKEDRNSKCRDLGEISALHEKGRLLEITTSSPWGELKLLQALFLKEQTAYILTVSVLKKEFIKLQKEILKAFKSFRFIKELKDPIQDAAKRAQFGAFFHELKDSQEPQKSWQALQKKVQEHEELGSYWAFLALKEGYQTIFKKEVQ